ncbi:sigma-54-dependent transcriptional regulator [Candidatus Neomarinimicrobiota bacterium]
MLNFHILLIDDEPAQITSIKSFLKRRGYTVSSTNSGPDGINIVKDGNIDLVFTDYRMPEMNGLEVVQSIKEINPELSIVVMTAFSDIKDAVQVMKDGAFDYLSKPIQLDELEILVKKAQERNDLISENKLLKEQLVGKFKFDSIVTKSPKMEKILSITGRVAKSNSTVLVRGETGTGKELIAQALHFGSDRQNKPLITVNCAALSENLLESELFGHEKGSFTGASSQRIGRFEQANGGTLFIDEIGDISLQTQVKLLRALQFGEFERIGGTKTLKVDVRVITATNRNLEEMIGNGQFRKDLYYRINVIAINLPALRERKEDIPLLIKHFIDKFSKEIGKDVRNISKEAHNQLMHYHFPGNIRELRNIIESAVVMARGEIITINDFTPDVLTSSESTALNPHNFQNSYDDKLEAFETTMIKDALDLKGGNQSQAAQVLGITERHLRSRMQKYSIKNKSR